MGWEVWACGRRLLPTGQAQVWPIMGWVAESADLIVFRWGPTGCLSCWGEGLPSYPFPPGLLPASRG